MNRFIAVMGVGRCGSSAVAGMLHEGGVPMGNDLIGPHPVWNARGHYEDPKWHRLNRMVAHYLDDRPAIRPETVDRYPDFGCRAAPLKLLLDAYAGQVARARRDIWGRKCIFLGYIWSHVAHLFGDDVRIVTVHRNREATIRSRMAHSHMTYKDAAALIDALGERIDDVTGTTEHAVLPVSYEELVADPIRVAHELSVLIDWDDFNVTAASMHIDPELDHYG